MRDLMLAAIAFDALVEHRMSFRKLLNLSPQGLEQDPASANPLIKGVEASAHGSQALVQRCEALLHAGEAPLHLAPHGSQPL